MSRSEAKIIAENNGKVLGSISKVRLLNCQDSKPTVKNKPG